MTDIGREQIATLIPHAGTMCLLDAVVRWDARSIRCRTRRHERVDNPLRRADGRLSAVSGVEIAAQAMAVHSRLIAEAHGQPAPGYLTTLRDVRLYAPHLDGVDELLVDAELLAGDTRGATYRFVVSGANRDLLSGRATFLLGTA